VSVIFVQTDCSDRRLVKAAITIIRLSLSCTTKLICSIGLRRHERRRSVYTYVFPWLRRAGNHGTMNSEWASAQTVEMEITKSTLCVSKLCSLPQSKLVRQIWSQLVTHTHTQTSSHSTKVITRLSGFDLLTVSHMNSGSQSDSHLLVTYSLGR
jgi:hypothetical protein